MILIDSMEKVFRESGFDVEKNAKIFGLSGIEHHFTFLLSGKKGEKTIVEFSEASDIELDILKLIIKCIDTDISHAILILKKDISPNKDVYKMAEKNGIKIISLSKLTHMK